MASAGTVTLELDANSVKLIRELQKSQRATQRTANSMQKRMTRAFRAIRSSVLSAGVAISAFAAFRGFSRIIGEIDQMGKMVDRLGGSTEAFSELQFVAERSGLAFNTLTMGMQRMSRRVAEAASGFGEAKAALAELGLNAKALNEIPIDKQLEFIADALVRVKNDADKTRLAMKLFDSEGVALLQAMTKGASGIRELREEAKKLGFSLSTEQVEAATRAKDAMTSLDAAAQGLARTLALKLAPSMAQVLDGWNNMLTGNRAAQITNRMDEIRRKLNLKGRNRPKSYKALEDEFAALAKELEELENGATSFGVELETVNEIIVTSGKKADVYGTMLEKLQSRFATAEQRAESLRSQLKFFYNDLTEGQRAMMQAEIFETLTSGIEEIDLQSLPKLRKTAEKTMKQVSTYADEAARNMQDAFAEFFFDPFHEGLRGMVSGFLDAIREMLANQLAAQFMTFLSATFGIGKSGGSSGGGGFSGFRAAGGPVRAGGSYIVGERGPELFVPNMSGSIVPNAGGTTTIYNIEAGADVATIMSTVIPALEQTKNAAVSEVINRKREGRL